MKRADVVVSTCWCRGVLFTVLVVSAAVKSEIVRGPTNIVGIYHENVTLDCHSDEGQEVQWKFTPFGGTDFVNITGHHGTSWSSRGHHSLTLERLTFGSAGKYECRLEGPSSGGTDAATAYVVVVADPPRCRDDRGGPAAHGDAAMTIMECSVTFVGHHNLTLEWLAANGTVLRRGRYWSDGLTTVARLPVNVDVRTMSRHSASLPGYQCRAYFSNETSEFTDQASNAPEFRRNTCTVQLSSHATPPVDDNRTSAQPSLSVIIAVVVAVLFVVAALLAIIVCRCNLIKNGTCTLNLPGRRGNGDDAANTQNHEVESMLPDKNNKCVGGAPSSGGLSQANETTAQVTDASLPTTSQSQPESERQQGLLQLPAQLHTAAEAAPAASVDATTADIHVSDPPTTDGGSRPTSDGRQEPDAVQENPNDDAAVLAPGAVSLQESVVNSPDSAASGPEYDLHADSSIVSQPNDEPYAEDEFG